MHLPNDFDRPLALECAGLILQAYEQYTALAASQPWSLDSGYSELVRLSARPAGFLSHPEPFGFVARHHSTGNIFVVFRGTETPADWLSDFNFPQKRQAGGGHAETGFHNLYNQRTCGPAILSALQSMGNVPNVIVTGHSLGAALATLAAADLAQNAAVSLYVSLYTFAGPRVGDPAFAETFNRAVPNAWRIVNSEDIVPTLPLASAIVDTPRPRSLLGILTAAAGKLNFQHAGIPVVFTAHKGSVAANHDMALYRSALLE